MQNNGKKLNKKEEKIRDTLLEKSQEAFTLALELYNRPTIKYRVEAFSFFICNAWELMLKAQIINTQGFSSIFFRNDNTRTISITDCIRRVFTDKKEPLRVNLETIVGLRDTSTHFITIEYEQLYAELFQSCVFNYVNKLNEFFNIDVTEKFDQHFLSLSVNVDSLDVNAIKTKYPPQIASQILSESTDIKQAAENIDNTTFSIPINHTTYITKNKKDADFIVSVVKNADQKTAIINHMRDPKDTHPFSYNGIVTQINNWIKLKHIGYIVKTAELESRRSFTSNDLRLFIKFYNVKSNIDLAYRHVVGRNIQFTYSQKLINLIEKEIKKHPRSVIKNLKQALANNKKV